MPVYSEKLRDQYLLQGIQPSHLTSPVLLWMGMSCRSYCRVLEVPSAGGERGDTATSVMLQPAPDPAAVGENFQKERQTEVHGAEELLRGVVECARDLSKNISVLGCG